MITTFRNSRLARKFELGDYVRVIADDDTNGLVGMVFDDDGDPEDMDPYWVTLPNGDEEPFSAGELIPWAPMIGERVIEADDEGISGEIVEIGDGASLVKWTGFIELQVWRNRKLVPACP